MGVAGAIAEKSKHRHHMMGEERVFNFGWCIKCCVDFRDSTAFSRFNPISSAQITWIYPVAAQVVAFRDRSVIRYATQFWPLLAKDLRQLCRLYDRQL